MEFMGERLGDYPHHVLGEAPAISGSDEVFSLLFAVASSISVSFLTRNREKAWLSCAFV